MGTDRNQVDKFKGAAREHGCDPDEQCWEERLKKVATHKPPTDDEIRNELIALMEQSKQVLRRSGLSQAEIEARIGAKGRKRRISKSGTPK